MNILALFEVGIGDVKLFHPFCQPLPFFFANHDFIQYSIKFKNIFNLFCWRNSMGASHFISGNKPQNRPHFSVGFWGLLLNLIGRRLNEKAFISRPIGCFWMSWLFNMVEAAGIEPATGCFEPIMINHQRPSITIKIMEVRFILRCRYVVFDCL